MKTLVPRSLAALMMFAALGASPFPARAENITVVLDQAKILRLPDRVATIVIGNPQVADGSLQAGGLFVVTGKGYGSTNIIALDAKGSTLAEHTIRVAAPQESTVTIYRGVNRETWSCAPKCERSVVLGDAQDYFEGTAKQTDLRNNQAGGQQATSAK